MLPSLWIYISITTAVFFSLSIIIAWSWTQGLCTLLVTSLVLFDFYILMFVLVLPRLMPLCNLLALLCPATGVIFMFLPLLFVRDHLIYSLNLLWRSICLHIIHTPVYFLSISPLGTIFVCTGGCYTWSKTLDLTPSSFILDDWKSARCIMTSFWVLTKNNWAATHRSFVYQHIPLVYDDWHVTQIILAYMSYSFCSSLVSRGTLLSLFN